MEVNLVDDSKCISCDELAKQVKKLRLWSGGMFGVTMVVIMLAIFGDSSPAAKPFCVYTAPVLTCLMLWVSNHIEYKTKAAVLECRRYYEGRDER